MAEEQLKKYNWLHNGEVLVRMYDGLTCKNNADIGYLHLISLINLMSLKYRIHF